MLFCDSGNDADMRLGKATQGGEFSGPTRSHLQDQEDIFRAGTQDGERQSDMIIQIALGGQGWALVSEDLRHELFRGCFAVAPGNADHCGRQLSAVPSSQVLERSQGIIHADADCPVGRYDAKVLGKQESRRTVLNGG